MTVSFAQTLWHSLVRAGLPHPQKFRIYCGGACLFLCKIIHLPGSPPSPWSVSVKDPSSPWWLPLLTCVRRYQGSAAKMLRAKVCFCLRVCVCQSLRHVRLVVSLWTEPARLLCLWDFPGETTTQVVALSSCSSYTLVGNFYFVLAASFIETLYLNCWTFVFLRISELAIGSSVVVLHILRSLCHRNQWPLVFMRYIRMLGWLLFPSLFCAENVEPWGQAVSGRYSLLSLLSHDVSFKI